MPVPNGQTETRHVLIAVRRTFPPVGPIERTGEAEMDEMWSFVAKKGHQRWLWYVINHHTGTVLCLWSPQSTIPV